MPPCELAHSLDRRCHRMFGGFHKTATGVMMRVWEVP